RQGARTHHAGAHPAQHHEPASRSGNDPVRPRRARGGGVVLSGARGAAAHAFMGAHAVRRADAHRGRATSCPLPRPCHRYNRARPQSPGRRVARRAGPQTEARTMSLIEIRDLRLSIGDVPILRGVDLDIAPGKVMGLVGESGSGKSMTALALMRLLPRGARVSGRITFDGMDILTAPEAAMCRLRGRHIGMVFQEPMTALNPLKTIGEQVAEGIRWHTGANRADAEARARAMLERVGLPENRFPLTRYPHELSGGQRQRVVIAIACA